MPTADITERGLESLITRHMTGEEGLAVTADAPANPDVLDAPEVLGEDMGKLDVDAVTEGTDT